LINKKTVFVLGAGASCPYGYPSGSRLLQRVCLPEGFMNSYTSGVMDKQAVETRLLDIKKFKDAFNKARIKSIDLFMAINPKLAPIGKYIIAFEILRAEQQSLFGEEAKFEREIFAYRKSQGDSNPRSWLSQPLFEGDDWYFYLYNRLIAGLADKNALPDFSKGNLAFITFNYDRSLEQFLYESLINSFTEVPESDISKCLQKLKILHVYGQIAPLKWQDPKQGMDYKPTIGESLLERAAANIKTIYEQKVSPELNEARQILEQAEQIYFLGFGYAKENLEILKLPGKTKRETLIYGTTFGLEVREKIDIRSKIIEWMPVEFHDQVTVGHMQSTENMDCLKLLRNYL
jgi:hypothetical protein